jgi:hypothetical protein
LGGGRRAGISGGHSMQGMCFPQPTTPIKNAEAKKTVRMAMPYFDASGRTLPIHRLRVTGNFRKSVFLVECGGSGEMGLPSQPPEFYLACLTGACE